MYAFARVLSTDVEVDDAERCAVSDWRNEYEAKSSCAPAVPCIIARLFYVFMGTLHLYT